MLHPPEHDHKERDTSQPVASWSQTSHHQARTVTGDLAALLFGVQSLLQVRLVQRRPEAA